MSLQDHYARRQDYRAGELCEAEWDQAEERAARNLCRWIGVAMLAGMGLAGWLIAS